jgi:translation initiation factor 1 (eIF-1/SUI1)
VVPHGHVDRDDPISSQARRREQEREELSAAISKWLGGGGKATDSIGLLRRAIDGDDVSAVKKLLSGSSVNDRTCAVKDSDLDRAAERQCSDPLFKLLVRGEGTAHDTDSLKQLADRFKKGSAAGARLQQLAKAVKENGGDLEAAGLTEPPAQSGSPAANGPAGPSIGGGGGGPKMGK